MSVFNVFLNLVAQLLAFVYALYGNYAFAIVGLTLVIMFVLTPLTLKGTRSMMLLQQLQPELKKLQTRFKDDRQKLNEETLKFYKENELSPLGGCLPLMVQMPVFFILYEVLRGLTRRANTAGFDLGWVSGQLGSSPSLTKPPGINPAQSFDPAYLNHNSTMYRSLSETNVMQAWGMDLSESASKALQSGLVHAIPYLLLIVIVGISGFVQQKQIQGRNPNQQVNPQQQMIMKVMPIFLPVISFGLPSGLVVYFAVSNLYRVGQQWFISRSIYGPAGMTAPAVGASGGSGSTPPTTSGGGLLARLTRAASASGGRDGAGPSKTAAKPEAKPQKVPADAQTRSPSTRVGSRSTGRGRATDKRPPAAAPAKVTRPAPKKRAGTPSDTPGGAALQPRARKPKKG